MLTTLIKDRWLFDQLNEPAFLLNTERCILGINRAAAKLFNVSEENVIGKPCHTVTGFDGVMAAAPSVRSCRVVSEKIPRPRVPAGMQRHFDLYRTHPAPQ